MFIFILNYIHLFYFFLYCIMCSFLYFFSFLFHLICVFFFFFFFSSRRRHTRSLRDWSSDVCSSDLLALTFVVITGEIDLSFPSIMALGTAVFCLLVKADLPQWLALIGGFATEIGRASCRERV